MSRVGKMPITVPQGVDVTIAADKISVKGPLGTLTRTTNPLVVVKNETLPFLTVKTCLWNVLRRHSLLLLLLKDFFQPIHNAHGNMVYRTI